MSNERAIKLPGGGTAYVYDVIPHREATILRKHHLKIGRYIGSVRDLDGNTIRDYRPDLTDAQQDEKDELIVSTNALYVRTLTRRWDGVTDADGIPIAFPDDVERMSEPDLEYLADVLLTQGRADPNAVAPPSESSSTPGSGQKTRRSAKT